VGGFVAYWLGFSPLIFATGYELLSCLRQQESNQRNAVDFKHHSLNFSEEIMGMKGTRS